MSQALYKQLVEDILAKLSSGEIKVGDRLPPESNYALQLGVSRSTLRLAFSQLEQSGIIKRKQRGGTEIISQKPVKKFNMVTSGLYDIAGSVRNNLLIVTDVETVKTTEIDELAGYENISKRWLSCAGNRYNSEHSLPLSWSRVYIPSNYSDIDIVAGQRVEAIFKMIENRYSVSLGRVKQSVSAVLCTDSIAVKLGLEEGGPLLCVFAELFDTKGGLIEFGHSYFNPSRVSVNSDVEVVS